MQRPVSTFVLRIRAAMVCALLLTAVALSGGCNNDNGNYDHTPPAGQGSMVVNNDGPMNDTVYVDGVSVGITMDGHWQAYDLAPGTHRVVLDETNGDRSWADDVDILENKVTVLDITGTAGSRLAVDVYFQ